MASVIDNNFLRKYIEALQNLFSAKLEVNSVDVLPEELDNAARKLTNMLSYSFITPEAKGLALLYSIQRLIPYAAANGKEQELHLRFIAILLEQAHIELVLYNADQANYSILYELVDSINVCAEAKPLLARYLALVANPETVILQEIAPIVAGLPATDAIKACVIKNNLEALKLLLPYIVTPQHKYACLERLIKGRDEIIDTAFDASLAWLNVNDINEYFHKAAYNGATAIVQLLLNRGAAIDRDDRRDRNGNTALISASRNGHLEVVRLLLDRGAAIDRQDRYGNTALIEAACHGRLDVVQLLLDRGAAIDHSSGLRNTALIWASHNGHLNVVQLLLDRGAAINHSNEVGHTALIEAANYGKLDVVRLLLDRGAAIDYRNQYRDTALIRAAFNGYINIVQLLLDRGADINHSNEVGHTALIAAAMNGHLETIKSLLLNRRVDLNHSNEVGYTALMFAIISGNPDIVQLLLDRGADVNIRNNEGQTALDLALDIPQHSCALLLQQHNSANRVNAASRIRPS